MSSFRCQFCKGSLTKAHYPKLYNMAHLLSLNDLLLPKDLAIIFYKLLTDHTITGLPLKSESAEEMWLSQIIHTYQPYLFVWVVISLKHIMSVLTS